MGVIIPSSLVGGITGSQMGGLKSSVIGTAIGAGIGGGFVLGADRMHKKQAKAAEEVLKRRGHKPLPKIVKTTEEESKN